MSEGEKVGLFKQSMDKLSFMSLPSLRKSFAVMSMTDVRDMLVEAAEDRIERIKKLQQLQKSECWDLNRFIAEIMGADSEWFIKYFAGLRREAQL